MKTSLLTQCKFHCLLCLMFISFTKAEVFAAVSRLQILEKEEAIVLVAFNQYMTDDVPFRNSALQEIYKEINTDIICTDDHDEDICAGNPLNVLHLLYRCLEVWPTVIHLMFCDLCIVTSKEIVFNTTYGEIMTESEVWPTEYDMQAAIGVLLRLRTTYQLNIEKLLQGIIYDTQTTPLKWPIIKLIILKAEALEMFEEVFLWCDAVLAMLPTKRESIRIEIAVRQIQARIYVEVGLTENAAELLREYSSAGTKSVIEDFHYYDSMLNEGKDDVHEWPFKLTDAEIDNTEKQLCRHDLKTQKEVSSLHCYFSPTWIPYFKGKTEEMNLDPRIMVFHDVISDDEIDFLKKEASLTFHRSGLQTAGKKVENDDNTRVSFTGWVGDDSFIALKITRRVQLISGLDTSHQEQFSNAEHFQVVNYGIGGYFNTHKDNMYHPLWGPPNDNDAYYMQGSGDRIATWMFYINDVKAGGATVFPKLNTRIPVIKGAAAFWFNLLPNGEVDHRVVHGGCPVLLGSKWISNKWIRETGQIFRRPCGLDYNDTL